MENIEKNKNICNIDIKVYKESIEKNSNIDEIDKIKITNIFRENLNICSLNHTSDEEIKKLEIILSKQGLKIYDYHIYNPENISKIIEKNKYDNNFILKNPQEIDNFIINFNSQPRNIKEADEKLLDTKSLYTYMLITGYPKKACNEFKKYRDIQNKLSITYATAKQEENKVFYVRDDIDSWLNKIEYDLFNSDKQLANNFQFKIGEYPYKNRSEIVNDILEYRFLKSKRDEFSRKHQKEFLTLGFEFNGFTMSNDEIQLYKDKIKKKQHINIDIVKNLEQSNNNFDPQTLFEKFIKNKFPENYNEIIDYLYLNNEEILDSSLNKKTLLENLVLITNDKDINNNFKNYLQNDNKLRRKFRKIFNLKNDENYRLELATKIKKFRKNKELLQKELENEKNIVFKILKQNNHIQEQLNEFENSIELYLETTDIIRLINNKSIVDSVEKIEIEKIERFKKIEENINDINNKIKEELIEYRKHISCWYDASFHTKINEINNYFHRYELDHEKRSVEYTMKNHNNIIIHAFDNSSVPNQKTSLQNSKNIDFKDKFETILAYEPAISCSMIKPGDTAANMWKRTGIILGSGYIYESYNKDIRSDALSIKDRFATHQKNVSTEIEKIANDNQRFSYTEIILGDNVKPIGIYFDRSQYTGQHTDYLLDKQIIDSGVIEVAEKYNLPIFQIRYGEVYLTKFNKEENSISKIGEAIPAEKLAEYKTLKINEEQKNKLRDDLKINFQFGINKVNIV